MRARESLVVGFDGKSPVALAADLWPEEAITAYLDRVAEGEALDRAVESLGENVTATQVRRVRQRDEDFRRRYEAARKEGRAVYRAELRREARERKATSDRILEVELATHVPEYAHLRRDRIRHEGRIEHGIVISLDPSVLDALPVERLKEIRDVLSELGGEIIDGEIQELPA